MIKIGVDARLLDRVKNTGISRYTEFILNYYIQKFGNKQIWIITNDRMLDYKGCNIIFTKFKPYNILHFLAYSHFISSLRLELLHIPFYSGMCFKLGTTKIIVTVHDLMYRNVKDFFGSNFILNYCKRAYFDFIVKRTLLNSNIIITVSKVTKDDLLNAFRIKSIHIPEYSKIISTIKSDEILKKHDLHKKQYFFYCGNNRPHKNLQFVIEIFNSLPEFPPLVLAGRGHSNSKNVKSVGVVSEDDLRSLYASSIAFIFPSKYEGFGLPILEALDCKTLVIASRIRAFTEFKSENILYFDIGDRGGLISTLVKAINRTFVEEPFFFDDYSIDRIYKLLDMNCRYLLG